MLTRILVAESGRRSKLDNPTLSQKTSRNTTIGKENETEKGNYMREERQRANF